MTTNTETEMIRDDQALVGARTERGLAHRIWDDGYGPLWVYQCYLGPLGIVRARTWEDAWACVVDEIMDDADEETLKEMMEMEGTDEGDLPEGYHWRGSGVPSNEGLNSPIACEDINGSALYRLTPELACDLGIVLDIQDED